MLARVERKEQRVEGKEESTLHSNTMRREGHVRSSAA